MPAQSRQHLLSVSHLEGDHIRRDAFYVDLHSGHCYITGVDGVEEVVSVVGPDIALVHKRKHAWVWHAGVGNPALQQTGHATVIADT
jgi:hypothetical protein